MPGFLLIILWGLLLGLILVLPPGVQGDQAISNSIRVALVCYALSLAVQLRGGSVRLARQSWSMAWFTYVVHVILAFHYFHDWSHGHAVEHVRAVGGVGEGIYASHLFGLLWTVDVIWWWLSPDSHARRARWMTITLHGFMLFIVFNATVVFASGIARWMGVGLFVMLVWMWSVRPISDAS